METKRSTSGGEHDLLRMAVGPDIVGKGAKKVTGHPSGKTRTAPNIY